MLVVESLSKRYAGKPTVNAVEAVALSIEKGQFVAIVGRSGSGKSTLLGMLGGICRPTSGKILIEGVDQWTMTSNAHCDFRNINVGFVFQFASLLPTLRVIDNVALPALVGGRLSHRAAYARARALLLQVGLAHRAEFYPHQLSGGEQRRAAIARALVNSPDVLLADEPTADLDEQTEQEILNLLIDIHRAFKLTMVVVTHNMVIASQADRVLKMQNGRVVSNSQGGSIPGTQTDQQQLASAQDAERVRRMFASTPEQVSAERLQLGEGFEAFIGRLTLVILSVLTLVWLISCGISRIETAMIDQKASEHQALEDLAMSGLRADVKNVTFGPGKSYIVELYLRNTIGTQPIYVLSPSVRAFVQVGSNWLEVPISPLDSAAQKQLKITSTHVYRYVLEPKITDFTQVIPYYMHVRLSNEMLVSPNSQPKDDIIDRTDNYYVYLKPHGADDAAVLTKLKFPGAPPVWIPMPPH
jgi:putative ABC transport system ATP-binding protein/macrolide transport system ATP-binding/permease protein/lipoprotein-releasing system ATP-binding protein